MRESMQYCRRGVELVVDATRGPRPWRADNSGVVEPRCLSSRLGSRNMDTNAARAFEPRQSDRWGLTSDPRGPRLGTAALVANLLNRAKRVQGNTIGRI